MVVRISFVIGMMSSLYTFIMLEIFPSPLILIDIIQDYKRLSCKAVDNPSASVSRINHRWFSNNEGVFSPLFFMNNSVKEKGDRSLSSRATVHFIWTPLPWPSELPPEESGSVHVACYRQTNRSAQGLLPPRKPHTWAVFKSIRVS